MAISALKRHDDPEVGRIPLHYVEAVRSAGGVPEVLSAYELHPDEKVPEGLRVRTSVDPGDGSLLDGVAGLILSGGGDVDPSAYGREPHPRTTNVNPLRDRLELTLCDISTSRDLPLLAICRGMQLLNVYLGGTLEQHLADVSGRLPHDRDRPRVDPVHEVRMNDGNLLADCLGATVTGVNSHHHQALDRVADPLEKIGWAEDGVLEAVVSTDHAWVVGVQWHPEVMAPVHEDQAKIFSCFIEAARRFEAAVPISA